MGIILKTNPGESLKYHLNIQSSNPWLERLLGMYFRAKCAKNAKLFAVLFIFKRLNSQAFSGKFSRKADQTDYLGQKEIIVRIFNIVSVQNSARRNRPRINGHRQNRPKKADKIVSNQCIRYICYCGWGLMKPFKPQDNYWATFSIKLFETRNIKLCYTVKFFDLFNKRLIKAAKLREFFWSEWEKKKAREREREKEWQLILCV